VGAARTGRRAIDALMALEIIKMVGRKLGGAA
jgi:hypothetical protein